MRLLWTCVGRSLSSLPSQHNCHSTLTRSADPPSKQRNDEFTTHNKNYNIENVKCHPKLFLEPNSEHQKHVKIKITQNRTTKMNASESGSIWELNMKIELRLGEFTEWRGKIHENENSLYHCRAFLAFLFYFLLCHVIRTDTKAHLRYNTPTTSDWIKIARRKREVICSI